MNRQAKEIQKRRERARTEGFHIELDDGDEAVWRFRVQGSSQRTYTVTIGRIDGIVPTCTCYDYRRNGLETCKHIEGVFMDLREKSSVDGPRSFPTVLPSDPDIVSFDLETQHLFQDVGGRHNIEKLALSVAVTYSTVDGYAVYEEDEAEALIERLLRADLVVGFNVLNFDYRVLIPYGGTRVYGAPTLDMLVEVRHVLGHRVSLDSLAHATLNATKTADGIQAVKWWRQGQIDLIKQYCQDDVEVTHRLFEHGWRHRYLRLKDARTSQVKQVEATWSRIELEGPAQAAE